MKKLFRSFIFFSFLIAIFSSIFYLSIIFFPTLPSPQNPPMLYSNQCHDDLRLITIQSLNKAKNSIHMVMFGLSDVSIIDALRKKAKIPMKLYYDHRSSPALFIPNNQAEKIKTKGLLHQKILIIDKKIVFIGSANMTHASLSMHDNLMIGFYSPEIANFLTHKAPYSSGYIRGMVGGQDIELWLLPDMQNKALAALRELIHSAKKNIFVAMFTFTHPVLVDEIIKAHKKGVQVECIIDFHSSMGASGKVVEKLKHAHVPVSFSSGPQLLHHKMMLIDDKTLVSGSANWTKSAFIKNNDCFFILHHLTPKQKRFIKKLKKVLTYHSKS